MGLIYATLGEHETAVEQFMAATRLDNFLAVASVTPLSHSPLPVHSTTSSYFQCGVSNFLLGRYDLSSKDFDEALLFLRGNQSMYVAPQVVIVLAHTTHLATILNLALPLHYIPPRFYLTKVSSLLIASLVFFKSSVRSLFGLSWPDARGDGRAGGGHEAKGNRGAQRDR